MNISFSIRSIEKMSGAKTIHNDVSNSNDAYQISNGACQQFK